MILQRIKGLILNLFTDYESDSESYWNLRWRLRHDDVRGLEQYRNRWKTEITQLMKEHGCENVLEVGCGMAWLRSLPGYLGSDYSREVFRQNGLKRFLVADATVSLPLPSKSFDALVSCFFLMHQSPEKAKVASNEMMRVAKRLIVLKESTENVVLKRHCFKHNYEELFGNFDGALGMLQWR